MPTTLQASTLLSSALGFGLFMTSASAYAGTVVANDVNISNADNHNIIIILTNNDPETFPYEQAYGPNNYWTKFDVIDNGDDSFSFRLNSKYLSASSDGSVDFTSSQSAATSFELIESDGDSYLIKTWRDTYLTTTGEGWKDVGQTYDLSDEARWYLFDSVDPSAGGLDDVLISGSEVKNPMIVLNGTKVETFPHQDAYGPFNYWTNWEVIDNGDGSSSFKLNGKYMTTDPNTGETTIQAWSDDAKYTLVSDTQYSFHLQTSGGQYLETQGTGWKAVTVSNAMSDATRWNFFQPIALDVPEPAFSMVSTVQSGVNEDWASVSFSTPMAAPVVFADMQTFNGSDTAGLRIDAVDGNGFEVFVEEETSQDTELGHNAENIGYLALEQGVLFDADGNAIGELGLVSLEQADDDSWATMNELVLSYENPVVRMTMNSYNGPDPAHVRLRSVQADSFQYQVEEWGYLDGYHASEDLAYLIVEAGVHELANGYMLQAQTQRIDENAEAVNFAESFSSAPVVLSQSQTQDGNDPIVTRQQSISAASCSIWLQEEEAENGTHSDETIGIISIGD